MKLYIVLALVACVSCSDLQSDSYELTGNRRSGPFETDVEKAAAGGTPWFCHDLECPRFKVVKETDVYETREYEAGKWAYTEVSALLYSSAVTTGFKRLFGYISGSNTNNTKIPMTTPVITAVRPTTEHFARSNYTVAFFLPYEFHKATPEPTNEYVKIMSTPPSTAYVLSFGGFLVDDLTLAGHAEKLKVALLEDGHKPVEVPYFAASYDPPTRLTGRHNEIMMAQERIGWL